MFRICVCANPPASNEQLSPQPLQTTATALTLPSKCSVDAWTMHFLTLRELLLPSP